MSNAGKEEGKDDKVYYHYTNDDGAKGILEDGVIKESDPADGDAIYGRGTYLNQMSPQRK